ncbi:putative HAD-family hydrolase [Monocercomonoides exilis]|uniref:putative HAD-family hydrolase n=1 Tax=Monocercomonoides exilis TaxID=2049356 RepID=UPI003559B2A1|nr:putative HAD-family hydrolase [Monocercomonoides exilis]|eukprot:MONOS_9983.1-p1 / transcript=MONOS_9983.1 / gene=MONOS_9983 / organism=Monocercomonoides_exilis_PA203 / gene_product=HAD-family hydrolase / transcript_product=HAD-family hydrolase / location=Mono_scaffold00433:44168-45083(-) / protein_length=237 / sequence_SO=supercontig / SO=protein_coding / is_pseudo=false
MEQELRYNTVIFDFDGTISYSLGMSVASRKALLNEYGLDKSEAQIEKEFRSLELSEELSTLFGRHLESEEFIEIKKRYLEIQKEKENDHLSLFPGMIEMMTELKHRNIKIGIVTNRLREAFNRHLHFYKLEDFFDFTFTPSEFIVSKPSPVPLNYTLNQIGIIDDAGKRKVLYVGDDEADIKCGQSANIDTALVPHSRHLHDLDIKPTYVLKTVTDVISLCCPTNKIEQSQESKLK